MPWDFFRFCCKVTVNCWFALCNDMTINKLLINNKVLKVTSSASSYTSDGPQINTVIFTFNLVAYLNSHFRRLECKLIHLCLITKEVSSSAWCPLCYSADALGWTELNSYLPKAQTVSCQSNTHAYSFSALVAWLSMVLNRLNSALPLPL